MPRAKRPPCSTAELEARTAVERTSWVEARNRSEYLLKAAKQVHTYLNGKTDDPAYTGDPSAIEEVFRQADAIRYAMNTALSVRRAVFEYAKKGKLPRPGSKKAARPPATQRPPRKAK
jgi:hypothetical protein